MGTIKSTFKIESDKPNYVFVPINLFDFDRLTNDFIDIFFSEDSIFSYFNAMEENYIFTPTKENYSCLFNDLGRFISFNYSAVSTAKQGRIGEYFLSIILSHYFHFDCIYPKIIDTTNEDMSIYGIDILYYSTIDNILMFGEAKFTNTLKDGITSIEDGLINYEEKIKKEYVYIKIKHAFEKAKSPELRELAAKAGNAIRFSSFIEMAKLTKIGIPLFVCHGNEIDVSQIIDELKAIRRPVSIFGLDVIYYIISLPIKNKTTFLDYLQIKLKEREKEYEQKSE